MDKGHPERVYKGKEFCRECLYWDVLCCKGLHVSPQALKICSMRGGSKLYDRGDAVADLVMCSTGYQQEAEYLWRKTSSHFDGVVRKGGGSDLGAITCGREKCLRRVSSHAHISAIHPVRSEYIIW